MELNASYFSRDLVRHFLTCRDDEESLLFEKSAAVRQLAIGNKVYMRGLIEISNKCRKDCLYCGIRRSNRHVMRYSLTDDEILEAARFADHHHYGSIVLQGGEQCDPAFVLRISRLIEEIKKASDNRLGITLSLGEQSQDTYRRWFDSGAHRYLLRIETSNPELYRRIHPEGQLHSHHTRLECLRRLQKCGYQTGTGVMIGLPFQTIDDLVDDLFFIRSLDIDMVGMGPYLEHAETPLWQHRHLLMPLSGRLQLSLHLIATLRLMMPDLNIAATTALQAIAPEGRETALRIGANVIMPNITPAINRSNYKLYENKPSLNERSEDFLPTLAAAIRASGCELTVGQWGDSHHFTNRTKNE